MPLNTPQKLNTLGSAAEERQVEEVLARLKVEVSRRRLLLYPYFRDFDRVRIPHNHDATLPIIRLILL